jgi:C1A family cysteine protease
MGKTETSLKYAIGIFLTLSIITGIKSINIEIPQITTKAASLSGEDIQLATLKSAIISVLKEYGIEIKELYFDTDISENGSININKVTIKLEKREDAKKATEIIKSQTGLSVEVK